MASLAIAIAIAIAIGGMIVAVLAVIRAQAAWRLPVWGVLFAGTVGAMHYSGMWAMKVAGSITWNPVGVVVSFMLCGLIAMSALWLLHRDRTIRMFAAASACLTVAICALHFTGMGAMSLTPKAAVTVSQADLPRDLIALSVGALTAVIVLAGLATLWTAARSATDVIEAAPLSHRRVTAGGWPITTRRIATCWATTPTAKRSPRPASRSKPV